MVLFCFGVTGDRHEMKQRPEIQVAPITRHEFGMLLGAAMVVSGDTDGDRFPGAAYRGELARLRCRIHEASCEAARHGRALSLLVVG